MSQQQRRQKEREDCAAGCFATRTHTTTVARIT
jgi:hypothetical protein